MTLLYDRQALIDTLLSHWPSPTSACSCGGVPLGASYIEHLADAYEAALTKKETSP